MAKIDNLLLPGEFVVKDQTAAYNQGLTNQADGKLYLTNRRLIFDVSDNSMYRGLELVLQGEKNAQIETIMIDLGDVSLVEKRRLAIDVHADTSIFREISGKKGLFGPKGAGREFAMDPMRFRFNFHIFVNKDEWVDEINSRKSQLGATQRRDIPPPPPDYGSPQSGGRPVPPPPQDSPMMKEKIVIKEIVKIKCSYCGKLYDQGSNNCPFCGASE